MNKHFSQLVRWAGRVLIIATLLVPPATAQREMPPPNNGQLVILSKLDGPPLPQGLPILEDYGAYVLAEVPRAQVPALPRANIVDLMPHRTAISLNGRVWDSRQGEPPIPANRRAQESDPYFVVQFYAPVKREWVAGLEALGVTFLGYHPNYTYIVRMDPTLLGQVRAAHAVQWVGHYHPYYRLAPEEELAKAPTDGGRLGLTVRGFPGENAASLHSRLEAAGVTVEWLSPVDPPLARVWAPRERLEELAALPGVYRVEPYDPPKLVNDGTSQVMHTWDVRKASRNGLLQDLMGAGQVAGMVDSGLDDNDTTPLHNDFYDWTSGVQTTRIAAAVAGSGCGGLCKCYGQDDANSSGHGTHVAGSIVGNGYDALLQRGLEGQARTSDPGFDYAWGVGQAPEAQMAFAYVSGRYFGIHGTLCGIGDARATWQNLYNQGARNVNNSWGNSTTTYAGDAVDADQVMWEAQDYLVVTSAGNAGPGADTVTQPATAKNILAVGASGNHRSVWAGDSQTASILTDFSSRGPITTGTSGDTRFKPDIVAPGADVLSTRSTFIGNSTVTLWQNELGDGDGDGQLDYWWSGGTSMAAPQITGAATVVRQYFQDVQGLGDATPPSAALMKAALVNGAVDMGYGYETNPTTYPYGGRNMQGWGMANLEQAITPRAPRSFFYDDFTDIDASDHTSNIGLDDSGDYVEYTVDVADSSEPLKVTLTWTDYQNGSSGYAVNNLNLLVTPPSGPPYYGNNFSGSWSDTTATYDALNNTEAVYIQNPATGTWTIRATAANAPTGDFQPFALFVSGGLGVTPAATRTCSGIASCTGRMGTSAQPYYPSIKPLSGSPAQVEAGYSFDTSFRVTNWGTTADTIHLSAVATTMTGASASGFSVTFNPTDPFSLASGASQDVVATVAVGSGVSNGAYDVSITAASAGTGSRKDVRVLALNVEPNGSLPNTSRVDSSRSVVSVTGPQVSPSFWACPSDPSTLWVAYLDGNSHNNSAAKVYAARSTDSGVTWTKWQLDANDGEHYFAPAIAGSADCSSVTVAWVRETTTDATPTFSYWLYSRTYASGTWGSIGTRDSLIGSSDYYMADPAVVYDDDATTPDILLAWLHYTGLAGSTGIYYAVNDDGTWGSATSLLTGAVHRYPALALDSANNDVWMAYRYSGSTSDVYVKYWDGDTNTWNGTNTVVANTGERENHPAIGYASGKLWVAWNRYADYSNPTPELYYTCSNSTLPAITWGTIHGPYGTRLAEHTPPSITGDASYSYIAYLAYTDLFRGGNIYALKVPATGGPPDTTYQLTYTADDPPLYARGNAGSPRLQWATTNLNNAGAITGPTLLYSKNVPTGDALESYYLANVGVAQALYNEEEDFDLCLAQVGSNAPTAVDLLWFETTGGKKLVTLGWETASEIDNLGFNLYRATEVYGARTKVNAELIPVLVPPGSPSGAVYGYVDGRLKNKTTYFYWLEDVDIYGHTELHGPVSATTLQGKPGP